MNKRRNHQIGSFGRDIHLHAFRIISAAAFSFLMICTASGSGHLIQYQYPGARSRYITRETNIIMRISGVVQKASILDPDIFQVSGSVSGKHRGKVDLSDDDRTIIFKPNRMFMYGELVNVRIFRGIRLLTGEEVVPPSFHFRITATRRGVLPEASFRLEEPDANRSLQREVLSILTPRQNSGGLISGETDSLPLDLPIIRTTTAVAPSPGRIFLSNFTFNPSIPNVPYLMILDDSARPVFYRKMPGVCLDFKMQPNGILTYYNLDTHSFYSLDSAYTVVDSFTCGNGYTTDLHEFRILDNGHSLLMSYDPQQIDMSRIVQGGDSSAIVLGLIVQELDRDKNVVFQWRSWDHFQITDATNEDLTASNIDYVHGNAIELDYDGNLLISSRHMDEITKIDKQTGEIIWRFGGKNNQFTFLNDSLGFSHQHAIRRLPNGNVTLFDNGNSHRVPFSRAAEYQLDELQKTAMLVWQYRHQPDIYGAAMGYVQRLENGNTLIGWGSSNPSVTEVRPDGEKVFELTMERGVFSYRAYRFPWKPQVRTAPQSLPLTYSLFQNFPNPFNGQTTILVDLPYESVVNMRIYNVQGEEVLNVVNALRRGPGEFFTQVDAATLPSGVYFYRLTAGDFSQARKMLLVK